MASPPGAPALELRGIDKWFGPVHANDHASLAVERGTIHGIVGENGAGKSTAMRIAFGYYQADSGAIFINGRQARIGGPADALALGVGMVHQHFMLVEPFTVLENLVLGAESGHMLRAGLDAAREHLERLEHTYALEVDPDAVVEELPVGLRQRVEILKALYRGAEILILDEPTGVLTPEETGHLFRILRGLRARGKTVILITHKLHEIMALTDAVTVMRRGRVAASLQTAEVSREAIAEMMVGRPVLPRVNKAAARRGGAILAVENLHVSDARGVMRVRDVSFTVHAGEIVGIAGVAGNGQSELLEALAGIRGADSGRMVFRGEPLPDRAGVAGGRRDCGIAHVPEDRQRMGLVGAFRAWENVVLGHHNRRPHGGWAVMRREAIIADTAAKMANYDIRPRAPQQRARSFSGGNQQKLVLARELETRPDLLLVGQPTRGVDIGAVEQIHRRLVAMRDAGGAILLVSVELDEIMVLADRILVMFGGEIMGEVTPHQATERNLGLMMAGERPLAA